MARNILRVDGIPSEVKEQLQEAAMRLYGHANASMLVRSLIADHLKAGTASDSVLPDFYKEKNSNAVRVELRLPQSFFSEIERRAEACFSTRNYYINSIIFGHLGKPQLQGNEIEVLRRSNYEMAKIGTNLNQISRAFNTLVKMGGGNELPELGKKMASLRKQIGEHTKLVLGVLESKTTFWESKRGGQKPSRKRGRKGHGL